MIRILCAAVHVKDGKNYEHQPKNVGSGFIVCGRRHHNCLNTLRILGNDYHKQQSEKAEQGFITSDDRFVDRTEGYFIAKEAGQLLHDLHDLSNPRLISEDMW